MAKSLTKEEIEKAGTERSVYYGGLVKSLGGNRIAGHVVIFTDENAPDLTGTDFFTKTTDYFLDPGNKIPMLYHHGLRGLGSMVIGKGKCNIDDVGVWMEGELALRADYVKQLGEKKSKAIIKALIKMVENGDLGFSTGSMPHLVETKSHDNGTEEIVSWPIGEISLTPTPMEPGTKAIVIKSYDEMPTAKPLSCDCEGEEDCACDKPAKEKMAPKKALHELLTQFITDNEEESGQTNIQVKKALAREAMTTVEKVDAMLAGTVIPSNANLKAFSRVLGIDFAILRDLRKPEMQKSIKGIYEDRLAEQQYRAWELYNTYCEVIRLIVNAKIGSDLAATEFDYKAKIEEANAEFAARLLTLTLSQAAEHLASPTRDEDSFYLRALGDPSADDFFSARHIAYEDHLSLAVSAFRSVIERTGLNHTARVKAGRTLSEKKRQQAIGFLDAIHEHETKAREYFDSMKPMATVIEKQKARTDFLRNEISARQITATVDTINERQTEGSA